MKNIRQHPPQPTATGGDLQEQIKRRAYQLFEERGNIHGHDLEDWLQAEIEVLDARDLAAVAAA
jgi:hypothetical protein